MKPSTLPSSGSHESWLLVRLDRIGDLVLTLPVDEALSGDKDWWLTKGLRFVAENAAPRRLARELDRKIQWAAFWKLLRETRAKRYTGAIIFHAPWWVGALVWLAGIPTRVGVRSQWHSFLFFNRGVRQKRSSAEHSELEYGYRLVEEALGQSHLPRTTLKLRAPADALMARGLTPRSYVVVHPGMAGSALNWPIAKYAELIERLCAHEKVVVTGTAVDEAYLAPLRARLPDKTNLIWLDGKLDARELLSILEGARGVVAPSTGVVHLAASLQVPTVGLYSPVRVQHPRRWGPQGSRVTTLMPAVECPGEKRCLGPRCPHYDCMEKISADAVIQALKTLSN